jgi:predicted dienelactone hydrolase
MSHTITRKCFLLIVLSLGYTLAYAENRTDTVRPDAPLLATYGEYTIGVQTLTIEHPQQIDVVNIDASQTTFAALPRYSRPLTLEIWYPAAADSQGTGPLYAFIRDGKTQVALHGKSIRDAKPLAAQTPLPLVVISHGYPGNRFLLAHLAENIASKGYVVASIDHTDSTYRTLGAFTSTLLNRSLDQLFTLNKIATLSQDPQSFLFGLVDTSNTGLIGYSMGGYGAMITAGAGISQSLIDQNAHLPAEVLNIHKHTDKAPLATDPRFKTVVAFGPWGMDKGVWDSAALNNVTMPMLFVAGSQDDVSGYEKGVRALWQGTTNAPRSLLTFDNAKHSAGAPMPAPEESFVYSQALDTHLSNHYTDPVWDTRRMNNISQHFLTAWLGQHLKQDPAMASYLKLIPHSNEGLWAKDKEGNTTSEHTYWQGFKNGTAMGLRFESLAKGQ